MKKKAAMILITAVLAFSSVLGPACPAAAAEEDAQEETAEDEEQSLLEQGTQIGEDIYQKVDEAIDSVDKRSLRRSIREALEEMDELGISPTAVAENTFGIRTTYSSHEKAPENTLIKDAQNAVQKKTEGFFSMLWDKFLDTIEDIIMSGISIFSGQEGSGAEGGKGL